MTKPQTVEEFERQYAERSHTTIERLHSRGRYGEACDCGDEKCQGFQMGHQWEDALCDNEEWDLEHNIFPWKLVSGEAQIFFCLQCGIPIRVSLQGGPFGPYFYDAHPGHARFCAEKREAAIRALSGGSPPALHQETEK